MVAAHHGVARCHPESADILWRGHSTRIGFSDVWISMELRQGHELVEDELVHGQICGVSDGMASSKQE